MYETHLPAAEKREKTMIGVSSRSAEIFLSMATWTCKGDTGQNLAPVDPNTTFLKLPPSVHGQCAPMPPHPTQYRDNIRLYMAVNHMLRDQKNNQSSAGVTHRAPGCQLVCGTLKSTTIFRNIHVWAQCKLKYTVWQNNLISRLFWSFQPHLTVIVSRLSCSVITEMTQFIIQWTLGYTVCAGFSVNQSAT